MCFDVPLFFLLFFSFFKGLSDVPSHQDARESITCQVAPGQGKRRAFLALPERETPATVLLPRGEQKAVCPVALHTDDQRPAAFRGVTAALLVFPYCYTAAVCWASPPGREKKNQNYVTHVHELEITLLINRVNLVSNKADTSFPKTRELSSQLWINDKMYLKQTQNSKPWRPVL